MAIGSLNTATPANTDSAGGGNEQLKEIKSALKDPTTGSFRNWTPGNDVLNATAPELDASVTNAANAVQRFGPAGSPRTPSGSPRTITCQTDDYNIDQIDDTPFAAHPVSAGSRNFFSDANYDELNTNIPADFARSAIRSASGIYGLDISWTSLTTFTVAAGQCAVTGYDSGAPGGYTAEWAQESMVLVTPMTKSLSTWSKGNNGGALETGKTLNTSFWYSVYLIKAVSGAVDVVISNDAVPVNSLVGGADTDWVFWKKIGHIYVNSSSQLDKFFSNGDNFVWDVPVANSAYNPAAPYTHSVHLAFLRAPAGAYPLFTVYVGDGRIAGAYSMECYIQDARQAQLNATSSRFHLATFTDARGFNGTFNQFMTDASNRVRFNINNNTPLGDINFNIITHGWSVDRSQL